MVGIDTLTVKALVVNLQPFSNWSNQHLIAKTVSIIKFAIEAGCTIRSAVQGFLPDPAAIVVNGTPFQKPCFISNHASILAVKRSD